MFIQLQIGEKIVTPRVRLLEPLNLAKELYKDLYKVDYEIVGDVVMFKKADELIFIRSRMWSESIPQALGAAKELYNNNYLLLHEMDDSAKRFNGYLELNFADFVLSHAITCSTEPLAEEFREFNPFVKVLKNQIAYLLPEKNFEEKDHVTIFFGALNRDNAWQDIMPILNKFAKKYKNKLRFMVISDMNFFNSLQTPNKLFAADKKFSDPRFVSYNIYMNELKKSDIALLPLDDTEFNRKKSDLKFIECGNATVAALASPVVYESTIEDGKNGFIYRSPREFQAKLKILIEDKIKRIEMAKAAREYVKRERQLKDHIEERFDFMREMYKRREELHKALLKRAEERFGLE